jgi:hypothetical protein
MNYSDAGGQHGSIGLTMFIYLHKKPCLLQLEILQRKRRQRTMSRKATKPIHEFAYEYEEKDKRMGMNVFP